MNLCRSPSPSASPRQSAAPGPRLACSPAPSKESDKDLAKRLQTALYPPYPDGIPWLSPQPVLQCEVGGLRTKFEDKRVELSRAGMLTVEGRAPADLTTTGTAVGQPKKPRSGRPFCLQIDGVDPACKFILDAGSIEQQHRWISQLRAVVGTAERQVAIHRDYTFNIAAADMELATFTIRHRSAKAVHKMLKAADVMVGLTFPSSIRDARKDFLHSEANWRQRGQDLQDYFQELVRKQDVLAHPVFKQNFGFDFADLAEKHGRVSTKVRKDPQLLRRAMTFLGLTGEIIDPGFASEEVADPGFAIEEAAPAAETSVDKAARPCRCA